MARGDYKKAVTWYYTLKGQEEAKQKRAAQKPRFKAKPLTKEEEKIVSAVVIFLGALFFLYCVFS